MELMAFPEFFTMDLLVWTTLTPSEHTFHGKGLDLLLLIYFQMEVIY